MKDMFNPVNATKNELLEKVTLNKNDLELCKVYINQYVLILEEEEDMYIDELTSKVECIKDGITWDLPAYQKINKSILRPLKCNTVEKVNFRQYPIILKEKKRIHNNWKTLVEILGVADKPEILARWRNKKKNHSFTKYERMRVLVTVYLAKDLKRTLHQVYMHFVKDYAYPTKGPYSTVEKIFIKLFFEIHPNKTAVTALSKILGREPRGLYKQYKCLLGEEIPNGLQTHVKWDIELAAKLIRSILKQSEKKCYELKDWIIPLDIWRKVERDLKIPYDHLKKMWYRKLHVQLYSPKPVSLRGTIKKIINALKMSKHEIWRDIRWKKLLRHFPEGYTSEFLHYYSSHIFRRVSLNYLVMPLPDLLEKMENNKTIWLKCYLKLVNLKCNDDGTSIYLEKRENTKVDHIDERRFIKEEKDEM